MTLAVAPVGSVATRASEPSASAVADGAADFTAVLGSFASAAAEVAAAPTACPDVDPAASETDAEGTNHSGQQASASDAEASVEVALFATGANVAQGVLPDGTVPPAAAGPSPSTVALRRTPVPRSVTPSSGPDENPAQTAMLFCRAAPALEPAAAATGDAPSAAFQNGHADPSREARRAAARVALNPFASTASDGAAALTLPPFSLAADPSSPPVAGSARGTAQPTVSSPAATIGAVGTTTGPQPLPPAIADLPGSGPVDAKSAASPPPPPSPSPPPQSASAHGHFASPAPPPGATVLAATQVPAPVSSPRLAGLAQDSVSTDGAGRARAPRVETSGAPRRTLPSAEPLASLVGGPFAAASSTTSPAFAPTSGSAIEPSPAPRTPLDASAAPALAVRETGGQIEVATARLGIVQVAVDGGAASLGVRLGVDTDAAATLLGTHQGRLEASLSAAGGRLDALSVDVRGGGGDPRRHAPAPAPAERHAAPVRAIRAATAVAASRAARPDRYA